MKRRDFLASSATGAIAPAGNAALTGFRIESENA
jgi:hypothetical protein